MILIIFGCNSFAIATTVVDEALKSHCPLLWYSTVPILIFDSKEVILISFAKTYFSISPEFDSAIRKIIGL